MIRTPEELMNDIKDYMGEMVSDDKSITLLENISDTLGQYNNRDSVDWKAKYEENDAEWKRKYTERFFAPIDPQNDIDSIKRNAETITFNDLFIHKEK